MITFDELLAKQSDNFRAAVIAQVKNLQYFLTLPLRVVHGELYREIDNIEDGIAIMDALTEYDRVNKIRYFPTQQIEMFEKGSWVPWYIIDDGIRYDCPREYIRMIKS